MIKLTVPIKGMTEQNISQTFHKAHKALDIISFLEWYKVRGAGTPLCAPEDCIVLKVIDSSVLGESRLKEGYGVYLKGIETEYTHLFWHTSPFFPVAEGQVVKRGQIVALMSNSGYVTTGGTLVPLEERTKPVFLATHLHWEIFDKGYKIGRKKNFINPLEHIDWKRQPEYTTTDALKAYGNVLAKASNILK